MTLEIAAYLGMGAVLLFGLTALFLAFFSDKKKADPHYGHHA